ncbi:MAG: hypothetical protein U0X20_09630 [Caldilineaceae bacterium]
MSAAPSASNAGAAGHSGQSMQWMNVMVEFSRSNNQEQDRPDQNRASQGTMSRSERYRRLRDNAQRHRDELTAWIASEGLEGEVKDMGDALAFDLLFVTATPQGAAALNRAPGVVAVRPAADLTGPGGKVGSSLGGVALAYG